MSEMQKQNRTVYEYKEVSVRSEKALLYLDGYESFGWQPDENFPMQESGGKVTLKLKRDRKIVNKTELTRLQRHFEANLEEIAALERSKTITAKLWASGIAILGTAFMAGSVFAVTAKPPNIMLCVLLAVPAFAGWVAPRFVYRFVREKKTKQVTPFIETKMEELYTLCENGNTLL